MAGKISSHLLSAAIHLDRRGATSPDFLLDISLEVPLGFTILFGPSGAGKSTILDCIAGLLHPEAGRIAAGGQVLFDSEMHVDLPPQKRGIAYVFQSLALFPHLTVEENVLYGLAAAHANQRREKVRAILEAFRIEKYASRKPREISGGEKQRTALARSLVRSPCALLLDEPLTGLDTGLKNSIVSDLRKWNEAQPIPILYVTHSRDEVDAIGERVIAIDAGKIVGEGTPHNVLGAPRHKRLAQASGFENILSGIVSELREADGDMRVRLERNSTAEIAEPNGSSCEIEVPLGHAAKGNRVVVAIRAGDILLAAQRPSGLSARNILEGKVVALEPRGTLMVVRVDCGVVFTVHVTLSAARELSLAAGQPTWLIIKTHSCHLVES